MRRVWQHISVLCILGMLLLSCSKKDAPQTTVLFDQGHGQGFLVEKNGTLDLSGLSALFLKQGFRVKTSTQKITKESLAGINVLISSGPFAPFAPDEISAITGFINNGGRMCIMLHIASPAAGLLEQLGIAISNGVIHEQENLIDGKALDFHITNMAPHDLTKGLKHFNVFGGWALINTMDNAEVIAQTSPKAWVDLNKDLTLSKGDAMQSLGIIVTGELGHGRFAVFGDDAIFQNRFLVNENLTLGRNLAKWLGE